MSLTWATVPLVLLGSYAVGELLSWIGAAIALRKFRKADGAPWMERARRAYPARVMAGKTLTLAPYALGAIIGSQVAPRLVLPVVPLTILGGLAALAATMRGVSRLERRFCQRLDGRVSRPGGVPVSFVLLLPGLVTFGLMVAAMPTRWDGTAAAITVAGLVAMIASTFACWLIPLEWLGLVKPAPARLSTIVDQAAARMGVRCRGVAVLQSPNANAIAWPIGRRIVFTEPIVAILDDDELATIAAHELGHLDEPWGMYLIRIASSLLIVALAATVPLMTSFGPSAGLGPCLALLVLIVLGRRGGRKMEERSDRLGREHEGENAGTYARALAKVYEANLMPAVMTSRRRAHPDLYDRMIAAGITPEDPRPDPPPGVGLANLPLLLLFAAALLAIVNRASSNLARDFPTPADHEARLAPGLRPMPDGDPGFRRITAD